MALLIVFCITSILWNLYLGANLYGVDCKRNIGAF